MRQGFTLALLATDSGGNEQHVFPGTASRFSLFVLLLLTTYYLPYTPNVSFEKQTEKNFFKYFETVVMLSF